VSRLRKEVVKELTSRWTLISDVGEHCCYARFMLAQKCLEVPVPLLLPSTVRAPASGLADRRIRSF
jgi:hypothetical protein